MLLLLLPAGCAAPEGRPLIRAGGAYSGVPDLPVGGNNQSDGGSWLDGTIRLNRDGFRPVN